MIPANPFAISDNDQFIVGDSDLAFFDNVGGRIEGCVILFCREGSADVIISQIQRTLKPNSLALLLPGAMLLLANRSEDFRVSFCSFSHDLFSEAAFRLDPSFFHSLRERPVTMASQHIAQGASIWFDMAVYTYSDRENMFRNTIIKNRLQNLLLETYDKMLRFAFPEQDRLAPARILRPGTRGIVLRRQALHLDPLPLEHRPTHRTYVGQTLHRPLGGARNQDDAPVHRPLGPGNSIQAQIPRPVVSGTFLQETHGTIAVGIPQQQKITQKNNAPYASETYFFGQIVSGVKKILIFASVDRLFAMNDYRTYMMMVMSMRSRSRRV